MAASNNGRLMQRRPRGGPRRGRQVLTAELAGLREAIYRLLSQALLYPQDERLTALVTAADDLAQESRALTQFAFFADVRRVLACVREAGHGARRRLEEQHVALFGANPAGVPCPPYESVFRASSGQPDGFLLAQVEAAYSEIGLAPSPELGELPDHVAIELEFMAMLCGREAAAWQERDDVKAGKAMRREKRFLHGHLGLWLPAWARRVAASDTGGFYRGVAEGAALFATYDRDYVVAFLEALAQSSEPPLEDRTNGSQVTS